MATNKLGKAEGLNPEQIAFCEAYVSREMFMNGTRAYASVYKNCTENSARVAASTLLTNINILDYIDSLVDDTELTPKRLDKELKKLALQDEDKSVKLQSIKHANDLRARIEQGRLKALEGEKKDNGLSGLSTQELLKLAYGDTKES